jgi:hypothetical protein
MSKASEITVAATIQGRHMEEAQKMLDAVHEYWSWRQRNNLHGAVCWVRDDSGRLVVFTRGEYAETIERAIREETGFLSGPSWGRE